MHAREEFIESGDSHRLLVRSWSPVDEPRATLVVVPGFHSHGAYYQRFAQTMERRNIVTFAIDGIDSARVKTALAQKKINVSTSGQNSTLLDFTARQLPVVVRAAPHYYNSEDEIEAMAAAVQALC